MKKFMLRIGLGIILCGLLSGGFTVGIAAPITFSFVGEVSLVDTGLSPTFKAGQTLAGSYTFQPAPPTSYGNYNGAITGFSGILESFSAVLNTSPPNFIAVRNDLTTGDYYRVSEPLTPVSSVSGLTSLQFLMELIDPSAGMLTNTGLPTAPPSLNSFATKGWPLAFGDASGTAQISGVLTSLPAVPLPTAVILFGAGLIALVGLGAGSWRQRKNDDA
ncbi:MAG: hypothetical protein ABIU05_12835 [Nitrospirales bacterium]